MHTIQREDPNCATCKQAPEGLFWEENRYKVPETVEQGSQEKSQKKHLKLVKEMLVNDLHLASLDRKSCLSHYRKLKKQVHCEFNALIDILEKREMNLCIEIEREFVSQMKKIDESITARCSDKIMNGNYEHDNPSAETMLTFNHDSDYLKKRLMCYGQLKYKYNEELNKNRNQELKGPVENYSQFLVYSDDSLSSDSLSELDSDSSSELDSDTSSQLDFITTSRAKNATFMSSASPVEEKVISNCKEDLKTNLYCEDLEKGSKCGDLYGVRDLNSIKYISDRIGSATNDVSEFARNEYPNSVGKFAYDAAILREIICLLRDRKCLAPAEAQVLFKACENLRDGCSESACLRDLSRALRRSANPVIRQHSEENRKKYNDLELENLTLKNRIQSLEKKLLLVIPNSVNQNGEIKTLQQSTGKSEPEALSAQIKKRFEVLANETIEVPQKEKMACQSFESTDSAPDKEAKMSESLENSIKGSEAKFADTDLESTKITSKCSENTDSSKSEEVDKDSSLDEDDMEIISRQETESIPSELPVSPPLPTKNRSTLDRRFSSVASIFRKKVPVKSPNSPRHKLIIEIPVSCVSKSQTNLLDSSNSNTEIKENQSFNEEPHQKPSNECFDSPMDVGQDNNPTVALRSSFAKYLEKTPESEWLAPVKSSDLSKPAENSWEERYVPISVNEMDQWRPLGSNQKISSDWLHPAHM